MSAEELLAIRGTPEFRAELQRQAVLLREHRRKYPDNYPEPDWEWLDTVWK